MFFSMGKAGGLVHLVTRHLVSASCMPGHLPGAGEARYVSLHISRCLVPTVVSPGKGVGGGCGRRREEEGGGESSQRKLL